MPLVLNQVMSRFGHQICRGGSSAFYQATGDQIPGWGQNKSMWSMDGSIEPSHNDVTLKTRMEAIFQMICQAVSRSQHGGLNTLLVFHFGVLSWIMGDLSVFWIFGSYVQTFRGFRSFQRGFRGLEARGIDPFKYSYRILLSTSHLRRDYVLYFYMYSTYRARCSVFLKLVII